MVVSCKFVLLCLSVYVCVHVLVSMFLHVLPYVLCSPTTLSLHTGSLSVDLSRP